MATGVEVAGLVLGSIPLILASLQFYAEGISVTKRYWRYQEEINSLLLELRTENTVYVNSIDLLLRGVVDPKDMAMFLTNPGGDLWKELKFDRRLQKRLGSTYLSYLENMNILVMTAERFKEKLGLDQSGKVHLPSILRTLVVSATPNHFEFHVDHSTQPQFTDKNAFKTNKRRFKFSICKS